MIFHLHAAGVPISWGITAIYKGSYGVARNAAESWYNKNITDNVNDHYRSANRQLDHPQYIVEFNRLISIKLEDNSETISWELVREQLWMDQDYYLGVGVSGRDVAHYLARRFTEDPAFLPNLEYCNCHSSDRDKALEMVKIIRVSLSTDRGHDISFGLDPLK